MLVSVIVTTYNRANVLPRCLDSLLAQTYKPLEIIVVDDGSTDDTHKLFESDYAYQNIEYVRLSANCGVTIARNKGLDIFRGDAYMIWDSDDILYDHCIQELVNVLDSDNSIGVVTAPGDYIQHGVKLPFRVLPSTRISFEQKKRNALPPNECIRLIRSECGRGLRFEGRNQDFIYSDRLARRCGWYHLEQALGQIYIKSDNNSLTLLRARPNMKWAKERVKPYEDYIRDFGDMLSQIAPKEISHCAYGAAIGLLLSGELAKARSYVQLMQKYDPGSKRTKAMWWLVKLPFADTLFICIYRIRVLLSKYTNK